MSFEDGHWLNCVELCISAGGPRRLRAGLSDAYAFESAKLEVLFPLSFLFPSAIFGIKDAKACLLLDGPECCNGEWQMQGRQTCGSPVRRDT